MSTLSLTNTLAEMTAFTQSQAAELRRRAGVGTLAGTATPTHVVPGTAHLRGKNTKPRTTITDSPMRTKLV
jgi:hypothetical protein